MWAIFQSSVLTEDPFELCVRVLLSLQAEDVQI